MIGLASVPSQVYYGLDLIAGLALGGRCPNCGSGSAANSIVARRHGGLVPIRRCSGCRVLYRPVGFTSGRLLAAYYSFLYTCAGIATSRELSNDPDELARRMTLDGKDRTPLVRSIAPPPRTVCVVGCSWGYELPPLQRAGYEVFGIETSRTRREYGRERLGLRIYDSVASAAHERGGADLVLSSHVLEHVPRVGALLGSITRLLRPATQLHITPSVESYGRSPALVEIIGREHPLGVTSSFWRRHADGHSLDLELVEPGNGEAIAILRQRTRDST